jgi:hypothetical protein
MVFNFQLPVLTESPVYPARLRPMAVDGAVNLMHRDNRTYVPRRA